MCASRVGSARSQLGSDQVINDRTGDSFRHRVTARRALTMPGNNLGTKERIARADREMPAPSEPGEVLAWLIALSLAVMRPAELSLGHRPCLLIRADITLAVVFANPRSVPVSPAALIVMLHTESMHGPAVQPFGCRAKSPGASCGSGSRSTGSWGAHSTWMRFSGMSSDGKIPLGAVGAN